jgi:hypothetical protein
VRNVARLHDEELAQVPDESARFRRLVQLNVAEQVFNLSRTPGGAAGVGERRHAAAARLGVRAQRRHPPGPRRHDDGRRDGPSQAAVLTRAGAEARDDRRPELRVG